MWFISDISFLICQRPDSVHGLIDFLDCIEVTETEAHGTCRECADGFMSGRCTVQTGSRHDAESLIQLQRCFCRIHVPDVEGDDGYAPGYVLKAVNRDAVNSPDTLQKKFCQSFFMSVDGVQSLGQDKVDTGRQSGITGRVRCSRFKFVRHEIGLLLILRSAARTTPHQRRDDLFKTIADIQTSRPLRTE